MLPLVRQASSFTGTSLAEAVRPKHLLLVDGTYVPTGNRPASGQEQESYSGKHRVQRLSVQVAATGNGELAAVSDPVTRQQARLQGPALCGWTQILDASGTRWIAATAYVATNALTPIMKTPVRKRFD